MTGINDPYESPQHAEIVLETISATPEQNARAILSLLIQRGFVPVLSIIMPDAERAQASTASLAQ